MYCINDEQIEYILNDIRRNGVEMEDLQLNLLDHICCILEQELKENDDFEHFYHKTVKRFYKRNLHEIEEETINLLIFKNYYAMRKVLIASGAFAVFAFITGSLFKTMYWPGASVLLTLGIGTFSLIFLPLLFIIKAREAKAASDKFVVAIGSVVGTMFSLAILFIVQHWPGANILLFSAIGLAAFVLLPAYFFTGIRRPETKLNTIVMSIILVGIIGLQYTMVRLRPSASQLKIKLETYAQSETLLRKMQATITPEKSAADINTISEELKSIVLQKTIGQPTIPKDYESTNLHFNEGSLGQEFDENGQGVQLVARLQTAVEAYNNTKASVDQKIPIANTVLQTDAAMAGKLYSNLAFLNSILLIQMHLAMAENNTAVAVH
jgi:hypothetical protein